MIGHEGTIGHEWPIGREGTHGLGDRGSNNRNILMSNSLIHRLIIIAKNNDLQVQKVAKIVVK